MPPAWLTMRLDDAIYQLGDQCRDIADVLYDRDLVTREQYEKLKTASALLNVLRRLTVVQTTVEMLKAFGSPGDWGYDTAIGSVLQQIGDVR